MRVEKIQCTYFSTISDKIYLEKIAVVNGLQSGNNRDNNQNFNLDICSRDLLSMFSLFWSLKYCVVTKNVSQHFNFIVSAHNSFVLNPTFGVLLEYKGNDYGSWVDILFLINLFSETVFTDFDRKYLIEAHLFRQVITCTITDEIMIDMAGLKRKHNINFSVKLYNIFKYESEASDTYNIEHVEKLLYGLSLYRWNYNLYLKSSKFYIKQVINLSFQAKEPFFFLLYQNASTHIVFSENIHTLKIYQFPHDYENIFLKKCKSNVTLRPYGYCLNITMEHTFNKYLFIRGNIRCHGKKRTCSSAVKPLSWNEASDQCEYFGGYLPILRNKDEMEEFTSLIKSTKGLPPIENVFIGLYYYKVGHYILIIPSTQSFTGNRREPIHTEITSVTGG